jgi:2-keto-3-deoxy-L-rhamnonate aldolase RhmA
MSSYVNPLRAKLRSTETQFGLWVTLESATVTEIAAELGLSWVCLDLEHGNLDYSHVVAHARAAKGSGTAVLVRVPAITSDAIKRCLDLGVDGVLLPLVRNAAELEIGYQYGRYPSRGIRGIGGERALRWGLKMSEYLTSANEETLILPVIETKEASDAIEDILQVDGLEAIFFGPADLSASRGYLGQWEGPGVADDIIRIAKLAATRNIACGIVGTDTEDILKRANQGFRMVAFGSDVGMIGRQIRPLLADLSGRTFKERWF